MSLLEMMQDASANPPLQLSSPVAVWHHYRLLGMPPQAAHDAAVATLPRLEASQHASVQAWLDAALAAANDLDAARQRLGQPLPAARVSRLVNTDSLLARQPRPSLIRGILRQAEVAMMVGATKTRKTWLALDMVLAVASGRAWIDHGTDAARTLYVDAECPAEVLGERLRILEPRGITPGRVGFSLRRGNPPKDLEQAAQHLREDIADSGAHLAVVDTLTAYWPVQDENDNAEATRLMGLVTRVAEDMQCAIVLVHHTPKATGSRRSVVDAGAGAGAYARRVDTVIAVREEEDEDDRKTTHMYLDVRSRSNVALPREKLKWEHMRAQIDRD